MPIAFAGLSAAAQTVPDFSADPADAAPYKPSFEQAVLAYEAGDTLRAIAIANIYAEEGLAEAQVMTGHMLLRGEIGVVDSQKALEWYRKAAEQKDDDAYMAIGEMALRSQAGLSPSDALGWFSKAAQQGRADAKRAIGEMYLKGQGIAPNQAKGQSWLQDAVDAGDSHAARKLADSYFKTDPKSALGYYEQAASYGDHEAAYIAGIMYAENVSIKPNSQKSADLLRQAADAGHAAAQADYGLLVYQGANVERSVEGAAEWFEKSARGGDSEGQFLYAFTLAKGEGVVQSFEEAYYWLLKSGDSGISDYDKDRTALRKRLEDNVDPKILDKARKKYSAKE